MELLHSFWRSSKRWRAIPLGPVSLVYRLARTTYVSNNERRRLRESIWHSSRLPKNHGEGFAITSERIATTPADTETALVVGVGPGLGFALARSFARAGMNVALASRNAERLDPLVRNLRSAHPPQRMFQAYGCDATSESSVKSLVSHVCSDMGVPNIVVYAVQGFDPGRLLNTEVAAVEGCWRANCLGAFIVAREVARRMVPKGRGTIVFVGSTSSLMGRVGHLNLAIGKFGQRALAQVMARELSPSGIHAVHLIIDADIKEDEADAESSQSSPDDISDFVYSLHKQPKSVWTSEVDARPWNEKFWEHC
jgi:NAD(P)-dependent dehydrogenase (short-subunit alcohol dehydrogenase family)